MRNQLVLNGFGEDISPKHWLGMSQVVTPQDALGIE
jgi:hypothetical protein